MTLKFTILGCGSSMGVPRVALGWGACDPNNPKNRRLRCSLLVERHGPNGVTRVLVDCSPDLRQQLVQAEIDHIDAALITHEHADHTHGIDDLRGLFVHARRRVDIYMDATTSEILRARFGYCFATPPGSEYPPTLQEHR
ncbi:MAG: MBL fold metallo-hydrolase, partial [Pseudolabrys sp.]|nr:MBL fold metallo-hydrolase [Pseudolabrys sp.]